MIRCCTVTFSDGGEVLFMVWDYRWMNFFISFIVSLWMKKITRIYPTPSLVGIDINATTLFIFKSGIRLVAWCWCFALGASMNTCSLSPTLKPCVLLFAITLPYLCWWCFHERLFILFTGYFNSSLSLLSCNISLHKSLFSLLRSLICSEFEIEFTWLVANAGGSCEWFMLVRISPRKVVSAWTLPIENVCLQIHALICLLQRLFVDTVYLLRMTLNFD